MRRLFYSLVAALGLVCASANADAAILTFDDVIVGQTSYAFDGDGDGISDVLFTTTDPAGFNTVGPGSNMSYIREPGLEGTSLLDPDLRVDFLVGAQDGLRFGFALDSASEGAGTFASFFVYDAANTLLASSTQPGLFTLPDGVNPSNYPEGIIAVAFGGTAAYGLFNFNSDFGRFIIDDFQGKFGTTEVPEPASLTLLVLGLAGMRAFRRARR